MLKEVEGSMDVIRSSDKQVSLVKNYRTYV